MLSQDQLNEVPGTTAYDADGDKIGKVGQVYLDDSTGEPAWLTVNTGLFGSSESFVPVRDVDLSGDRLVVGHDKDTIKDAPNVGDQGHLEPEDERRLYDHYGVDWGNDWDAADSANGTAFDTRRDATAGTADRDAAHVRPEGEDTSGPETDDAMTRSEERVQVGTTQQERGRARLRKYVVTEQETHTVPVRKERAVVESEPITDGNRGAAGAGPEISEEEHEVTLSEERAVVNKTTEPVERVRLGTTTETDEETVTEDVRKEKVEAEGDVDDTSRR